MTAEAAAGRGFNGFAPETLDLAGRTFIIRRATESDVPALVALLRDDVLGAARETGAQTVDHTGDAAAGSAPVTDPAPPDTEEADPYPRAFGLIDADPNQLLVAITESAGQADPAGRVDIADRTESADQTRSAGQTHDVSTVVGTLQLSLLPSLSRRGTLRLQIEAVRVGPSAQGIGLGTAVFEWAHECGRRFGAGLVQLTTDKSRTGAQRFYDRLGYVASHEGMKRPLD
ncbi:MULTISPECIES: GNAT family N-acetyltransferase [unclassified Brevibacterium]|uniref:GNAT family N-acetyltransferase n=1 Tax=unclassified Brevibacterium TaxID=2614124 RepID=UPI001091BE26|nr:GNAT family N-acetyltransferase [Brevibacterium sp. S22]TGD32050.1 GNAT family N-acetyltransferase [Brevibacterium sp. S22]